MSVKIVLMSDNETWDRADISLLLEITEGAYKKLLDGYGVNEVLKENGNLISSKEVM